MTRTLVSSLLLCALLAALPTNAHARRDMEAQLDTMNEQMALIQKNFLESHRRMEKDIKALEQMTRQIVKNQAELLLRFEGLVSSMSMTDGRIAESRNDIQQMAQQVTSLQNRLELLAKVVAGEELLAEQDATDPMIFFDRAYEDYMKQQYDMAVGGFEEYIMAEPAGAKVADAQYWIGESHYAQGNFNNAIVEFRKVITNHPSHEKAGDALLKIGLAQFSQGNYADAAGIFEEVMEKHSGTALARLAEERLKAAKSRM